MSREMSNPYESARWASLPGGVMRPGGLALTERLLHSSGLIPPAEILDLGCGTGAASQLLTGLGFSVTGLDRSEALLARAAESCPDLSTVLGDMRSLPFGEGHFDGILCECVLSGAQRDTVLGQCARVMRPDGVLMLSDLCLNEGKGQAGGEGTLPTPEDWNRALARHGFEIASYTDETAALTEFVLSFLLAGGSMEELRGCAGPLRRGEKVGYFALTALRRA